MTLSNYPKNFDDNSNLYEVHDYLRGQLAEDYNPGDAVIYIYGDSEILNRFPSTEQGGGIITLTDQCDEIEKRSISFYYTTKTFVNSTLIYFSGLEILKGFEDVKKYKDITNVTQNVMAEHHNSLKDAIINIEKFAGVKGEISKIPLEGTLEQRINYLRYLVLSPKAWFTIDKKIGLKPSTVTFNDLSFRLGTDGTSKKVYYTWKFDIVSNIYFSYSKSYSFEKLSTGEIKTKINFSIIEKSNNFSTQYTLQESRDGWETFNNIENLGHLIFSSVKKNPEYRLLVGDGGKSSGGLTIYLNLGQDVLEYTYYASGFFDASLNVKNDFGEDTVVLKNITNIREFCPSESKISFTKTESQFKAKDEYNNRKYSITSPVNLSVFIEVTENGQSYNDDPIVSYAWDIQDDLSHLNQDTARCSFSVGGIYDVVLRTDTKSGNYRITSFKSSIDIIEKSNLWLWMSRKSGTGVTLTAYEFGLISETFKTLSPQSINPKNNSFLGEINNDVNCSCDTDCCKSCYTYGEKCRKIREFDRNNGFAKIGNLGSSNINTDGVIYWSTGRSIDDDPEDENIFFLKYNAFGDYYSAYDSQPVERQWGWVGFTTDTKMYFLLGSKGKGIDTSAGLTDCKKPTISVPSNDAYDIDNTLNTLDLFNYFTSSCSLQSFNNINKESFLNYSAVDYSYYRSTWKDGTGYILSNESGNQFFRIRNFYKTSGTASSPITDLNKLNDMSGPVKTEGQLVSLTDSIYFFSNSGSISVYNPSTSVWTTGGPGSSSVAFRSLQDTSVDKFDDINQTLLATSDEDHNVYISYDYSPKSFIKFNDIDLTFRYLGGRPTEGGENRQWLSTIY